MKPADALVLQLSPTGTSLLHRQPFLLILRKMPNLRQSLGGFASQHELGYSSGKTHPQ
jgi:hypothetical protein